MLMASGQEPPAGGTYPGAEQPNITPRRRKQLGYASSLAVPSRRRQRRQEHTTSRFEPFPHGVGALGGSDRLADLLAA